MEFTAIEYFAHLLAGHTPCMQIVLTDLADTIYAYYYQTEFLTSLYLQYWRPDQATDTTRLSVAAHTFEVHATSGLSVMLANSTRVLHIAASQLAMKRGVMLHGGRIRSEWRECVLAPLRTLPDLRELWLTDMHMDSFMHTDSLPFGGSPDTKGRDIDSADILAGRGQAQAVAPVTTSLESVVVAFNCSARNCKHGLSIHPTLAALPKSPGTNSSPQDPSVAVPQSHPLGHLCLAIGYDAADLPRLRETWQSAQLPRRQGQVDLSARLLPELASGEYAYVHHAALVVQLMPHLALDAGELARLREHFAAVDVE